MKKIFTLIAVVVLSTGAFAQNKYVDLVENGHMEKEQDPDWSCFWCHEWRTNEEQFAGFANIVEDPTDPTNHCATVVVRTEAEADEAGTKVKPDGSDNLASWDCQFFVYVKQSIASGKMLRLTMRVRADKECQIETQAHNAPGDYNHYQLFGNISVTTQWQKVECEAIVNTSMTGEDNGKEMHTVAFNLSTLTDGNQFWFDDVKLEVKDQADPGQITGWFDFVNNGNLETDDVQNFIGRDAVNGEDLPARIVIDPKDGKRALNVTSEDVTRWDPDDNGEPNNPIYVRTDAEGNKTDVAGDDWLAQFFVTSKHVFHVGDQYKFVMWARADKPASVDSQIHRNAGDYLWYDMLGSFDLTEEWQRFEVTGTINGNQAGGWTFAFNLYKLKEYNNYYFRDIELCVNEAQVSDADRTLGSAAIQLPVPETGTTTAEVDMNDLVQVMKLDDLADFITGNTMKVIEDPEEDKFGDNTISVVYDGAVFNLDGQHDDGGSIILEMEDEVTEDNKAKFVITNIGEPLGDKSVDSRICFAKGQWYYVYDIRFVDISEYLGIQELKTASTKDNVIYDISGRRVAQPIKGIYIQNGKKFVK